MAHLCRNCYADCTEDIAVAPPKTKYRCKCGCDTFLYQPEEPTVPYELNANDRLFLRRLSVSAEDGQ